MQNHQGTLSIKQTQAQMDFEIAQGKLQIEQARLQIEQQKLQIEKMKIEADMINADKHIELKTAEIMMRDSDRDGIAAMDENKPRTKRKVEGTLPNGVLVTEETEGVGI
jgi:hypothetical protein